MRTLILILIVGGVAGCESENAAASGDASSDATPDGGVVDGEAPPGGDCREAARRCAPGFSCTLADGAWQCALIDDAGRPPGDAEPREDGGGPPDATLDPDAGSAVDAGLDGAADADPADGSAGDAQPAPDGGADGALDPDVADPDAGEADPDGGVGVDAQPEPDMCAAEVCNGEDDDCDGETDEDAPCEGGACRAGECVELAAPGAACADDADCASDDCLRGDEAPGGFCYQPCRDSGDCDGGLCLEIEDGARFCWEACDPDAGCRDGWTCLELDDDVAFCSVHCAEVPCGAGEVCDADSGLCEAAAVDISLIVEQAIILPGQVDGSKWDGFGDVPRQVFLDIGAALTEEDAFGAVLEVLGRAALVNLEKPDCYGTISLLVNGPANPENDIELPIRQDTFTPIWGAGWNGVPFGPDDEVRVRVELIDSDILDDDDVGVVTISHDDIQAALDAGDTYPVRVNLQAPQILFVSISAIEMRP